MRSKEALLVLQLERPTANGSSASESIDLVSTSLFVSLSASESSEKFLRELNINYLSASQVHQLLHTCFKAEDTLALVQSKKPMVAELVRSKLSHLTSLSTFVFTSTSTSKSQVAARFVISRDLLCDFSWITGEIDSEVNSLTEIYSGTSATNLVESPHWFESAFDSVKSAVLMGLKGPVLNASKVTESSVANALSVSTSNDCTAQPLSVTTNLPPVESSLITNTAFTAQTRSGDNLPQEWEWNDEQGVSLFPFFICLFSFTELVHLSFDSRQF